MRDIASREQWKASSRESFSRSDKKRCRKRSRLRLVLSFRELIIPVAPYVMADKVVGRPWTAEEDNLLIQAVAIHGQNDNWKQVALAVPGRTNKACRKVRDQ